MAVNTPIAVRIRGAGRAVPAGSPVTNAGILACDPDVREKGSAHIDDLAGRIDAKFGVARRYAVSQPWRSPRPGPGGETSEDLACSALAAALAKAGQDRPSLLIHGTTTTSRYTGSQAAAILGRLGIVAPAYEVKAGCSTSLAALHMAVAFLLAGVPDVAVACAETLSKVMHPDVRETWFGLADGGAALWMERCVGGPDFTITYSDFCTDGRYVDLYTTRGQLPPTADAILANGYCLQGDRDRLGELSRERYEAMLGQVAPTPVAGAGINWVIPHQVNRGLVADLLASRLPHAKVVWDAREFGNLGGTSVLFSLAGCLDRGDFAPGDRILLMSVGGGLSWAAQVWEKS
jgi:3-oxoacyl-[acyl-carrier-protein] synthase III